MTQFESEFIGAVGRMRDEFAVPVMRRTGELMRGSVKEGSPISNAPGQPVDKGNLRGSINMISEADGVIVFVDDTLASGAEVPPSVYAKTIEDAIGPHGPIRLRSSVGGFHSFEMTMLAGDRFVSQAVKDVLGGSSIGTDEGAE